MTAIAICYACGRMVTVPVEIRGAAIRPVSAAACSHCGAPLGTYKFRAGTPTSEPRPVRNGGGSLAPDLSTTHQPEARATEAYPIPPFQRGVA